MMVMKGLPFPLRQAGESVSEILENMNTDKNSYVRLIKPQL